MHQDLVTFEARSPEELVEVIAKFSAKDTRTCLYSALAISDPQLLIYFFNLKGKTFPEAKEEVCNEVKEIFSLSIDQIDYDFQIFHSETGYITGVCAAIPKKLLSRYLEILDKNRLVPQRILPYSSAIVDYYFQKHKDPSASFCIVDFSKKYMVNLGIFKNDCCELMRSIPYENLRDAKPEIVESLKNTCLMTEVRKLDHIYFAGMLEDKLDIIREVEEAFQAKVERDHSIDIVTALSMNDYYFNVNFATSYVFSPTERRRAIHVTNLVLALYVLFAVYCGFKLFHQAMALKELNASYTVSEYDYAKNLKKEMDAL